MAEPNVAQLNFLQMPPIPFLRVLNGPAANQYIPLDFAFLREKPLVMGRPSNRVKIDVPLYDPELKVSSPHAELSFREEDGCLLLRDLASRNGTYVNGKRLFGASIEDDIIVSGSVPLLPGDIITCGKVNLLFAIPGWQEPPELRGSVGVERSYFLQDHQPGFASLEVIRTDIPELQPGTVLRLTPQRIFSIGRRTDNDLPLLEEDVSRHHAELCWVKTGYVLTDMGAANTSYIVHDLGDSNKDEPIDVPRLLRDGDIIGIGTTLLNYRAARMPYFKPSEQQATGNSAATGTLKTVGVLRYVSTYRPLDIGPREFELPYERQVLIGRSDDNNLRLIDPSISRRHARIYFENGKFVITDVGSANHTQINSQDINAATLLSIGDRIKMGDFEFVFDIQPLGNAQSTLRLSQDTLSLQLGHRSEAAADSGSPKPSDTSTKGVKVIDHELRGHPLFRQLDSANFNLLAPCFKKVSFEQNTEIAREGQNKGAFFVIIEGTVVISRTLDSGDRLILSEIGPNAVYGERTIYANQPFTNRLTAKTKVTAWQLDELIFIRELAQHKSILAFFQQQVSLYSTINWLRGTLLMRTLSEETLNRISSRLRFKVFGPGEKLVEKGESCNEFYLIVTGRAMAYTVNSKGQEQELTTLETGDTFGDGIAAADETYPITVRAQNLVECYVLHRADFEIVLQNSGDPIAGVPHGLSSLPISAVLSRVSPFNTMPPQLVAQIAAKMKLKRFRKGETIVIQDEVASAFYFIKSGQVELYYNTSDGKRRTNMKLGPGQFFGEASLLTNTERTDTVIAVEDCELLALYRNNLQEVLRLGESYALGQYFAKNLSKRFRPKRSSDVTVTEQVSASGEHFYILRRKSGDNYFRLSDRSYFLWELMDGDSTVSDLTTASFLKYGSLDINGISNTVGQLQAGGFLELPPVDQQLLTTGERKETAFAKILHKVQKVLNAHYQIKNIDGVAGKLYKGFGRIFFWTPIAWFLIALAVVGFGSFVIAAVTAKFANSMENGLGWIGILLLILVFVANLFLHEISHALAVKHYGRHVSGGGIGWGYLYVNTGEIWLENRGRRIIVNLAGPFTNAILGSVCAVALFFIPSDSAWEPLLFQMAALAFILVYLNFNPFIETDGYFALMDWVEMPSLRRKAMVWLRNNFIKRKKSKSIKPRERRIFLLFGLLVVLYLPLTVVLYLALIGQIAWFLFFTITADTHITLAFTALITFIVAIYTVYNLGTDMLAVSKRPEEEDDSLSPNRKRGRRRKN